jgi:hypothetical protein
MALIRVIPQAASWSIGSCAARPREEMEMREMDPNVILVMFVFLVVIVWIFNVIRKLDQRLQALEKQHLALVAELEDRLYPR